MFSISFAIHLIPIVMPSYQYFTLILFHFFLHDIVILYYNLIKCNAKRNDVSMFWNFLCFINCIKTIKIQIQSNWCENVLNKPYMHQNIWYIDHIPANLICYCFKQCVKNQKFALNASSLEEHLVIWKFHKWMEHNTTKHCSRWYCL